MSKASLPCPYYLQKEAYMNAIAENQNKRIFAENEAELLNECMKSVLLGMQSLDVVEKVAVGDKWANTPRCPRG